MGLSEWEHDLTRTKQVSNRLPERRQGVDAVEPLQRQSGPRPNHCGEAVEVRFGKRGMSTLMKKSGFLFFFALPLAAQISNVSVLGVTNTQAVIQYTAPDTTACTVAVSASPT